MDTFTCTSASLRSASLSFVTHLMIGLVECFVEVHRGACEEQKQHTQVSGGHICEGEDGRNECARGTHRGRARPCSRARAGEHAARAAPCPPSRPSEARAPRRHHPRAASAPLHRRSPEPTGRRHPRPYRPGSRRRRPAQHPRRRPRHRAAAAPSPASSRSSQAQTGSTYRAAALMDCSSRWLAAWREPRSSRSGTAKSALCIGVRKQIRWVKSWVTLQ